MTHIEKSVEVVAPASVCYRLVSDFANYPKYFTHIGEVHATEAPDIWHWVVEGPFGHELEFDVEVNAEAPDQRITWRTVHGDARITYSGIATFDEIAPRHTRVTVRIDYHAPGGKLGEFLVKTLEHPERLIEENLYRFKIMAELQAEETHTASYAPGGVRRDKI